MMEVVAGFSIDGLFFVVGCVLSYQNAGTRGAENEVFRTHTSDESIDRAPYI